MHKTESAYDCRMPNIAIALKSEISRIARKELRSETEAFKKASSQYRSQIASLRRRVEMLERELRRAVGANAKAGSVDPSHDAGTAQRRFSPVRLAATRKKLGLSAAEFGALIGVTGQSIYKWESGDTRPRVQQLEAIASVRGIGKREAAARLEAVRAAE